jgi:hypothetical protein
MSAFSVLTRIAERLKAKDDEQRTFWVECRACRTPYPTTWAELEGEDGQIPLCDECLEAAFRIMKKRGQIDG